MERLEAEEGEAEGSASVRITKQHAVHDNALSRYRELCAMQRALLDLLLPCLVLALPRGGGGNEGPGSVGAGEAPPPAKAQRRSAHG